MRLPFRQRFTIFLNEFGTGLAGNGRALSDALHKSNPALREFDNVLKILADQNRTLAALAVNGDTALEPLARERERIKGFINASAKTASATASRSAALEENFRLLPAVPARARADDEQPRRLSRRRCSRPPRRSAARADDINTFVTGHAAVRRGGSQGPHDARRQHRHRRPRARAVAAVREGPRLAGEPGQAALDEPLAAAALAALRERDQQPPERHLPARRRDERVRPVRPLRARAARADAPARRTRRRTSSGARPTSARTSAPRRRRRSRRSGGTPASSTASTAQRQAVADAIPPAP